ncbi:hypothetical protein G9A89_013388 [Geosiphon pyriformis]|nr:hypothetical protein G9A89_013388 [Geosiphon pyriformis]
MSENSTDYYHHQSLCTPSYGFVIHLTPQRITYIILQRTSINKNKPKVAKSENIGANYLGFVKSLFQQYSQQLGLNSNHYPAESAFNFYVNNKITECLGGTVNIEAARENFYTELFQHTNLPRNYSFAPIIREINQTIERYTQQQFPITYADKDKGRLQTLAKKQRIESPPYLSYHHIPGSTINILSAGASTPNDHMVNILKDLNRDYQCHQEFDHCHLHQILKSLIHPIAYALITKLDNFTGKEDDTQVWLNDVEKAIAANGWNDAQAIQAIFYFLKDTANLWYQNLINKPQNFNVFKVEFLRYFSNNNSINHLINTFTTIKQGETEAVTTYLGCFYRNLCQIQAIDTNYFTAPQILNQFIRGLHSSILQHVRPLHSGTLQDAVTHARDFESAESEANYAQAVNLVMNESSELDSKLKQFNNSINQKLERYLADNCTIYQPPQ